ncbi:MAG: hypothetical protein MUE96_00945 [Bacteroidia bacterium]|nr:hypothetical protein [Bacteroidia bacterium]
MNDLQLYKMRLNMELAQHEKQLEQRWIFLRSHFRTLVWHQVNPFKNKKVATGLLNALEPGLLPVVAELAIGVGKGKPLNGKVLLSSLKYLIATLGIKWLKKMIEQESPVQENKTETDSTDTDLIQQIQTNQ